MNAKLEIDFKKSDIIRTLRMGKKIPASCMTEVHHNLISGGYADFISEKMAANWKTDSWRPEAAIRAPFVADEPIENRFEILDL